MSHKFQHSSPYKLARYQKMMHKSDQIIASRTFVQFSTVSIQSFCSSLGRPTQTPSRLEAYRQMF